METAVHVIAIVGSAVGATWVLSAKLNSILIALTSLDARVGVVEGKVIKLEKRVKR